MDRRKFLYTGIGTVLAARSALTQTATGTRKVKISLNSKHLQWLRSADEVADALVEMSFDGVVLAVLPYPGHIDPAKAAQDLSPFVSALRKRGIEVTSIATALVDPDSPNAEEILRAASSAGITHYRFGPFRYEQRQSASEQINALKPRLTKIASLNAKYKITGLLDTSGKDSIGASLWDLMTVIKDIEPGQIGIDYDVLQQGQSSNWELALRNTGRHVAAITVRDFEYQQDLGLKGGGGAYTAPPVSENPRGGGRGARGPGGPPGGRGGRGGRSNAAAAPVVPGLANGWKVQPVPLGTGMVNLPQLGIVLKEIGFSGPIEIDVDYPNGGADQGQDKIVSPSVQVLGTMKRDLLALRSAFARAG